MVMRGLERASPFGRLRPLSVLGSDPSRKATRLLLKNSADPSVGLGAVHPALQVGVVLRPGVEAIHRDGHLGLLRVSSW